MNRSSAPRGLKLTPVRVGPLLERATSENEVAAQTKGVSIRTALTSATIESDALASQYCSTFGQQRRQVHEAQAVVSYSVAVTPAIARVLTWNWCRRGSAASNVRTSRTNDDRGKCAATANRTKPSESEVLVSRSIRMANLDTIIPTSLKVALDNEVARIKGTLSSVVTAALSQYLDVQVHTLFQVSTSGALVAGVYDREVSVRAILEHGDFGLGTFANLDGEMVVLDGRVYQVQGTGRVSEASPEAGAPFAVVTRFSPQTDVQTEPVASFKDLEACCDKFRNSGNIFYAICLDGHFKRVRTRAVRPPPPGTRLADAAKAQSEFTLTNIDGTLVGLWSPGFSSAFSIAGYHFHFLSNDRQHGGHVLDVDAERLRLRIEALTDFHLALPESEAFLKADLSKNTAEELAYAEQAH